MIAPADRGIALGPIPGLVVPVAAGFTARIEQGVANGV